MDGATLLQCRRNQNRLLKCRYFSVPIVRNVETAVPGGTFSSPCPPTTRGDRGFQGMAYLFFQ